MNKKKLHYLKSGFHIKSPCSFNRFKYDENEDTVTTDINKVTCKKCKTKITRG